MSALSPLAWKESAGYLFPMTQDQDAHGAAKKAADDVAADMKRRLEKLGEQIEQAEREKQRRPENLLGGVAGDPTAIHEGPLSGGATPSAAKHADTADED